jgi:hypothetical protein
MKAAASLLLVLCLLGLPPAVAPAADAGRTQAPDGFTPGHADVLAAGWLASAREALVLLANEPPGMQQDVYFSQAVCALTALYQLCGCEWALPRLRELYARPGHSELRFGYSPDGKISLRVERLELQNPAFDGYAIYLCTLQSETAQTLQGSASARLGFELLDGGHVSAAMLDEAHPLYPRLDQLQDSFSAPPLLPSGAALAFKQIFTVASIPVNRVSAVRLEWGGQTVEIPDLAHEVGLERIPGR